MSRRTNRCNLPKTVALRYRNGSGVKCYAAANSQPTLEPAIVFPAKRISTLDSAPTVPNTSFAIALGLCCMFAAEATWAGPLESVLDLMKSRCVKCHGPARHEGNLNLSTAAAVARGADGEPVVAAHDLESSSLWMRVERGEMPPDQPLETAEREVLRQWILAGTPGLPAARPGSEADDHWAFRPLVRPKVPQGSEAESKTAIDAFLETARLAAGVRSNSSAPAEKLIRRVSFAVTGLPPTLEELNRFRGVADPNNDGPNNYSQMVEYYLASQQYGVRWAKVWLDAAGYADSNGYFNADSDRPLAYRYRDYVVRSLNGDKPFDRFVLEQLAGDEIAGYVPGQVATGETIELLEATHFLRNGQDGSGESDGNPDEVRADRYYALESAMQNTASSLLGLTIQCAKCHDHKFEPITQLDYYRWQAVFYPAFNIEHWQKPNDRTVLAPLPEEQQAWESRKQTLDTQVAARSIELKQWLSDRRTPADVLFEDRFEQGLLSERWSHTAPGDDVPGGQVPVSLDASQAPAASINQGRLEIIEGNTRGDSWISTKRAFDWTEESVGDFVQVTFDLVQDHLADGVPAFRFGYLIGLHDFNDNGMVAGGNLLIDGNPNGGSSIHLDYPGDDATSIGTIGAFGYQSGHNYGVRVTNIGQGKVRLEHLVDMLPEGPSIEIASNQLPDGGFGFEYCCGRSFAVDNVTVERFTLSGRSEPEIQSLKALQEELKNLVSEREQLRKQPPGKIAWTTDMHDELPVVRMLQRGNVTTPGEVVDAGTLAILDDASSPFVVERPEGTRTSGRRLAWAKWLTAPGSRAASLLARVQANRIWQHHFGSGLVQTSENLGFSGSPPTHPELLDWLACELVEGGWSLKSLHRQILNSTAYRQSSLSQTDNFAVDPNNRLLWRFPMRRLEAEAIRDAMLTVSGEVDLGLGGPYTPTNRLTTGEVVAAEGDPKARRRSLFVHHKRTQVLSFLAVFDAPSIVFNSVRRNASTMPLQSLALLNSEFAVKRAEGLAERLQGMQSDILRQIECGYQLLFGRLPSEAEVRDGLAFLASQRQLYGSSENADRRSLQDYCQALLASNEFLYLD